MQLAFHKQMYNSICQYVNDMEEDLQNCVKTTSKLLTASYTTRSNWPQDLVKLVWRNPFTQMIVRLENPTLGGEWTSCFHCPPWCIFLGSLQSKCRCGFHPKKEMQLRVFIQRKHKLWLFMQRKECSCGFSSKERNAFMTIAFSRALWLRFWGSARSWINGYRHNWVRDLGDSSPRQIWGWSNCDSGQSWKFWVGMRLVTIEFTYSFSWVYIHTSY